MGAPASIDQKKKLFKLPFKEDELEYWGPLNHVFCNSFLTMGNNFFEKFLGHLDMKTSKGVFSAFVELVQNAAEYNEAHFQTNIPQTYVNVKILKGKILIKTANQILLKDVDSMKARLEDLDSASKEELDQLYKDALLNNKSLGLIMINRMSNAKLGWDFHENEDQIWLTVDWR